MCFLFVFGFVFGLTIDGTPLCILEFLYNLQLYNLQFFLLAVTCFWLFGIFQHTESLFLSTQCMPKTALRGWSSIGWFTWRFGGLADCLWPVSSSGLSRALRCSLKERETCCWCYLTGPAVSQFYPKTHTLRPLLVSGRITSFFYWCADVGKLQDLTEKWVAEWEFGSSINPLWGPGLSLKLSIHHHPSQLPKLILTDHLTDTFLRSSA